MVVLRQNIFGLNNMLFKETYYLEMHLIGRRDGVIFMMVLFFENSKLPLAVTYFN